MHAIAILNTITDNILSIYSVRVVMKNSTCYHIQLKSHRTTVSLDKIISDLIAIKLEKIPGTKEAHRAVRQQLEELISTDIDKESANYILYKIRKEAILFITDKMLSEKYFNNWEQQCKNVLS